MQKLSRVNKLAAMTLLIVAALLFQACTVTVPTATTGGAAPAAADAGAKWCSDVNIVFFPGGPAGGVFANNVYNGAKQAEADPGRRCSTSSLTGIRKR